jgi:hypothetical protein
MEMEMVTASYAYDSWVWHGISPKQASKLAKGRIIFMAVLLAQPFSLFNLLLR